MDAAAFKEVWNGQYGTLTFKDANNRLIHVATVVCGKENKDMYVKLLTKAMEFLPLAAILNNEKTTCFTDKHKGSDAALPQLCPDTEDRRCLEHLIRLLAAIGTVSFRGSMELVKA